MKRWFVLLIVALCLGVASAGGPRSRRATSTGPSPIAGGVLPGATVSVVAKSIGGAPRTTVTDTGGQFRFLNLDTATYTVTVELPGFTKQARDVIVNTGVNVQIPFTLAVGGLAETVMVTGASPVVDVKKAGTSTTLTTAELEGTPQSKDPWAALKTVPGVIVDRVNVGGNESGQQSGFVGKGTTVSDTMWNLDGVVITDVNSGGASSSYYDFNAFDEVNISTGGNDLRQQTGGIGINFVTRRGTNKFKGTLYVRGQQPQHGVDQSAERAGERQPAGAARRRLRRQGQPHRQDPEPRLRHRRPDRQGQALVLGVVGQAEHRHRPAGPDDRQDRADEHEREDQLGADSERSGLGVLLQRREGKVRPLARLRRQRAGVIPLEPGQLLS